MFGEDFAKSEIQPRLLMCKSYAWRPILPIIKLMGIKMAIQDFKTHHWSLNIQATYGCWALFRLWCGIMLWNQSITLSINRWVYGTIALNNWQSKYENSSIALGCSFHLSNTCFLEWLRFHYLIFMSTWSQFAFMSCAFNNDNY